MEDIDTVKGIKQRDEAREYILIKVEEEIKQDLKTKTK